MTRLQAATATVLALFALAFAAPAAAQLSTNAEKFIRVTNGYRLAPNITYLRAGGVELKLDVYQPRGADAPTPTLMYIHGGGWTNGTKEASALSVLPYLEMGWAVVNVEYRMADVAHAPAAVEDCRCALRWIYRNAERFNFDVDNIVVTGNSAGGHLSLATGFVPASAGLDRQCPGDRNRTWTTGNRSTAELNVAAVINWYGITDVYDLLHDTPGTSGNFTMAWLGSQANRDEVAKQVSPTEYIRGDLPPVLTIHGDADSIVPYKHATRLHEALDGAGVANELITIAGGGHGGFSDDEMLHIFTSIQAFLKSHDIGE